MAGRLSKPFWETLSDQTTKRAAAQYAFPFPHTRNDGPAVLLLHFGFRFQLVLKFFLGIFYDPPRSHRLEFDGRLTFTPGCPHGQRAARRAAALRPVLSWFGFVAGPRQQHSRHVLILHDFSLCVHFICLGKQEDFLIVIISQI